MLRFVRQDWRRRRRNLSEAGLCGEAAYFARMPNASRLSIYGATLLCLVASFAETTPFSLGTADLAPDPRLDEFRSVGLAAAFQTEATKQLKLDFEVDPLTDLERLQQENTLLKERVARLEERLAALEAVVSGLRHSGG